MTVSFETIKKKKSPYEHCIITYTPGNLSFLHVGWGLYRQVIWTEIQAYSKA